MRVTHVTDCYLPRVGGIERQVHDLSLRQQQAGHQVRIVTCVAGTQPDAEVVVQRPKAGRGGSPGRIRYEWSPRGVQAVLSSGVDVVHVHASTWSPLAFSTVALASRLGVPTVMTVHSLWAYATPLFRWADRAIQWGRWPVAWSAVSTMAAEPLERIVGPDVPVAILPNGVDVQAWQMPLRPTDPNRVVIASVGRLARRKRQPQLLKMLRHARAEVPRRIAMEAVIVGDGPLRGCLQRYLERHDMCDWVRLTGAADHQQIRQIYQDADFYVAPATLESFGIAALEARCAGLPVIARTGTGITDFITHGREGLLAGGDDDMTARIVQLATCAASRSRAREHNAATIPAISWADILESSDKLYQRAGALANPGSTIRPPRLLPR